MHKKPEKSISDSVVKERIEIFHSHEMGATYNSEFILACDGESVKYIFIFHEKVPDKAQITVRLRARNTHAEIVSLFLGSGEMRSDISFTLSHEAPDTYARVVFKAALRDASRVNLNGMLAIARGADGSDAYLNARALILSKKAMARIDPQLEILAHNIKASHGATVGRVSAQDLFYLQSRGLTKRSAERVLLLGYFSDAFSAMPSDVANDLHQEISTF